MSAKIATRLASSVAVCMLYAAGTAAQYSDDFQSERVGLPPSHWMESGYDERWDDAQPHWVVDTEGDNQFLSAQQLTGERKVLLHTFSSNVVYSGDFRVVQHGNHEESQVTFVVRGNSAEDRVIVAYMFNKGRWELKERNGLVREISTNNVVENPSRLLTTADWQPDDKWHHIEVNTVDDEILVWLDDAPLMSATGLQHLSYGRTGVEVRWAHVHIDNIYLEGDGEGRVHDGVKEIGGMHGELYTDMFKRADGVLTIRSDQNGNGVLESADDGDTFRFVREQELVRRELKNTIVLPNGNILDVSFENAGYFDAAVSTDNGKTWQEPVRLPDDPRNSDDMKTTYAESGRLHRVDNGRIFFVVPYGRSQGERVYYSDDDGASWTPGALLPVKQPDGVARFEAAHVIGCGGSRVAAFLRANDGYNYRIVSNDNGMSWGDNQRMEALKTTLADSAFDQDPETGLIYAVWTYERRLDADVPDCNTQGQWPRERLALASSDDCGATWTYLMDVDFWQGNDARFNQMNLRVIDDYIWISVHNHVVSSEMCGGEAYTVGGPDYDWRRLLRIEKDKLVPARMPPLLTR